MNNFVKWDDRFFNINLITSFGIGENEDGHYSLWIDFVCKDSNYVKWYKSENTRDKDFKKIQKVFNIKKEPNKTKEPNKNKKPNKNACRHAVIYNDICTTCNKHLIYNGTNWDVDPSNKD